MNAESTSTIKVVITGYGPFDSIIDNPSATIAKNVTKELARVYPSTPVSYEELKVSVEGTKSFFHRLEEEVADHLGDGFDSSKNVNAHPSNLVLLCHFGVHPAETGLIRLEVEGFNELNSSIPDVDGVYFTHELIDPVAGPLSFSLVSAFGEDGDENSSVKIRSHTTEQVGDCLEKINNALKLRASSETFSEDEDYRHVLPRFVVSHDAGRYLCNYTLFRGLQMEKKYPKKVFCVFIHVCDPLREINRGDAARNSVPLWSLLASKTQLYNPSVHEQTIQCAHLVKSLLSIMQSFDTNKS